MHSSDVIRTQTRLKNLNSVGDIGNKMLLCLSLDLDPAPMDVEPTDTGYGSSFEVIRIQMLFSHKNHQSGIKSSSEP